jgi:hypothetical protein
MKKSQPAPMKSAPAKKMEPMPKATPKSMPKKSGNGKKDALYD